jgi:regulator of replication initiation timing
LKPEERQEIELLKETIMELQKELGNLMQNKTSTKGLDEQLRALQERNQYLETENHHLKETVAHQSQRITSHQEETSQLRKKLSEVETSLELKTREVKKIREKWSQAIQNESPTSSTTVKKAPPRDHRGNESSEFYQYPKLAQSEAKERTPPRVPLDKDISNRGSGHGKHSTPSDISHSRARRESESSLLERHIPEVRPYLSYCEPSRRVKAEEM